MSIFTGAPTKSRVGTKSDVVCCDNNCLSYSVNNGSLLSARCRGGSARHNILERLRTLPQLPRVHHACRRRCGVCVRGRPPRHRRARRSPHRARRLAISARYLVSGFLSPAAFCAASSCPTVFSRRVNTPLSATISAAAMSSLCSASRAFFINVFYCAHCKHAEGAGTRGVEFFMKFIQVRASIYFLKGRSSDRESTNKLMNYAFCVGVDVEIPERKCKII